MSGAQHSYTFSTLARVRGSNLTGSHNRLSCPRSADTALKPYLTLPYLTSTFFIRGVHTSSCSIWESSRKRC